MEERRKAFLTRRRGDAEGRRDSTFERQCRIEEKLVISPARNVMMSTMFILLNRTATVALLCGFLIALSVDSIRAAIPTLSPPTPSPTPTPQVSENRDRLCCLSNRAISKFPERDPG